MPLQDLQNCREMLGKHRIFGVLTIKTMRCFSLTVGCNLASQCRAKENNHPIPSIPRLTMFMAGINHSKYALHQPKAGSPWLNHRGFRFGIVSGAGGRPRAPSPNFTWCYNGEVRGWEILVYWSFSKKRDSCSMGISLDCQIFICGMK